MLKVVALSLLVAGCARSPGNLVDPGPAPANGLQILFPVVQGIQPGQSLEYCTWTDQILQSEVDVKHAQVLQSLGGHHVVLFYTTKYQPPGTQRLCTDDDMATFRFAVGAAETTDVDAPGDLVFRIPAGAQLVANQHFLNATPNTLDVQSAMNLTFADPGSAMVPAGSLAFLDDSMRIAPGDQTLDIQCVMNTAQPVWQVFPHMHEWGKHASINLVHAGVATSIFDGDWEPDFAFHPPTFVRDISTPLMMMPGDQLNLHCEWNNDTGSDLTFGLEMCVAFAQTIDSDGQPNMACNKGSWGTF
jgi:hypothetical protein